MHVLKEVANGFWQAKSARVLGIELFEQQGKRAGMLREGGRVSAGPTNLAKPFLIVGHGVRVERRVHAIEVE